MASSSVTDATFQSEVLESDLPVVIDFWAEWCGPCKVIAPALEDIAAALAGTVRVVKLNIDDNPETPTRYGVRGIPTLMLFKQGDCIATKVGAVPKTEIESWISEHV